MSIEVKSRSCTDLYYNRSVNINFNNEKLKSHSCNSIVSLLIIKTFFHIFLIKFMRCPYVTLIYEKINIEELIFLLLFLRHIFCNNV